LREQLTLAAGTWHALGLNPASFDLESDARVTELSFPLSVHDSYCRGSRDPVISESGLMGFICQDNWWEVGMPVVVRISAFPDWLLISRCPYLLL